MPKTTRPPAPVVTATAFVRTMPADALLRLDELRAILGLPMTCLRREARLGRLRVAKRSGRYWVLGSWVNEWIVAGEVRPKVRPEN